MNQADRQLKYTCELKDWYTVTITHRRDKQEQPTQTSSQLAN